MYLSACNAADFSTTDATYCPFFAFAYYPLQCQTVTL